MPLCAFAIATLFSLPRAHALVVLIMGCLPGGNASNLLCYWCDADLNLRFCTFIQMCSRALGNVVLHSLKQTFTIPSIAMTALSTVLAFVMVPLCLLLYARGWVRDTISIPFVKISKIFVVENELLILSRYFNAF